MKSSLAITTTVGCRNACSYCPQKSFIKAYKALSDTVSMSFDTFTSCIETVPRNICLSFSGFSEPWLNPDCTRMILYAHEREFKIRVNTTLIGMKPEDIQQFNSVPFIKFVVHLPDNQNYTRIRVDETYIKNLHLLLETRPTNLTWKFHRTPPGIDVHPLVLEVLKKYKAPVQVFGLNNRAGQVNSGTKYERVNHGRVLRECQDFHHNILLPNGDVTLCHMDWSLKHILGNLLTMEYSAIHKGKAFMEIHKSLLNPDADILCRECEKDNVKRTMVQSFLYWFKKRFSGKNDLY